MRVLVVDDEPLAVDWLTRCLVRFPDVTVVGTAGDGDEALERTAALQPDLVLLDVQMPGRTGMAVARALARSPRPEVVFVTAFTDFAAEAFELEAADYLLKPVRVDRLEEAINRARRRLNLHQTYERIAALESAQPAAADPEPTADAYEAELWIRQRDGFARVAVEDIRRIEASKDYALIHTRLKSYILRTTMGELERRLDPDRITRVHRSAFARLDTVRRVERSGRTLLRLHTEDGAVVDVGASYARRVVAALGLEAEPEHA
jgi:DNA-binding LytR/AlgR family response regulator